MCVKLLLLVFVGFFFVCACVHVPDGAGNRGLLLVVGNALASKELSTAVGDLEHDGGLDLGCGLKDGVDGAGAHAVDGRDG